MSDAAAALQQLIADHDAKLAAAHDQVAELERRLALIAELAHLEAEQPSPAE